MKYAYLSLVLRPHGQVTRAEIQRIDRELDQISRAHEIVLVLEFDNDTLLDPIHPTGPLTVITAHANTLGDDGVVAGLARAAGDFVIEWRGATEDVDKHLLTAMLEPSDRGVELVEVLPSVSSFASRQFSHALNRLRPRDKPLLRPLGRVYSRRALQATLRTYGFEPHLDIVVAELSTGRSQLLAPNAYRRSTPLVRRMSTGLLLLARGSSFGSIFPIILALLSTIFGVAVVGYALVFFLVSGTTPEGWTTLMIVTGFGQAAILTTLSLIWLRLNNLLRGLGQPRDPTASVEVFPSHGSSRSPGREEDNDEA